MQAQKAETKTPNKTSLLPPKTLPLNAGGRGLIEKHRRHQMKHLYSSLASLIPPPDLPPQDKLLLPDLLDSSRDYVEKLRQRVELLKTKRDKLHEDLTMAAVDVYEKGSTLDVNLVTGLNKGFILCEVIAILEEGGARVLSANYSRLSDRIVYSVTCQAISPRIGIETSSVRQRLMLLSGAPSVLNNNHISKTETSSQTRLYV